MRWQGRRKSTNVVNRRGGGAAVPLILVVYFVRLLFSRLGLGAVVVLVGGYVVLRVLGYDPLSLVTGTPADGPHQEAAADLCETGGETEQFICVVLASTEDVWHAQFAARGADYPEPELHIFSDTVSAGGCGFASAAVGPFYCPETRAVYLDTGFFDELARRFGAPGDFAEAYVVSHEVGHHVQNVTGTLDQAMRARQGLTDSARNALQVRIELQADCYAGVWAHHENGFQALEPGDIAEALRAANAIGDDTLQENAGRRPVPDSFTHGTSAQRERWFRRGFDAGEMEACDTFSAESL